MLQAREEQERLLALMDVGSRVAAGAGAAARCVPSSGSAPDLATIAGSAPSFGSAAGSRRGSLDLAPRRSSRSFSGALNAARCAGTSACLMSWARMRGLGTKGDKGRQRGRSDMRVI